MHAIICLNAGDLVTIVIPYEDSEDDLLVTLRNKVVKLNWRTKQTELIAEVAAERGGKERFNDGKCDAKGRLWVGTVVEDASLGQGSLYRLDGNRFVRQAGPFVLSNGLTWSPDDTKLYFDDSEGKKIYSFDFDVESGSLSEYRVSNFFSEFFHSKQPVSEILSKYRVFQKNFSK